MKKALTMFLFVFALVVITACGKEETTTVQPTETTTTEAVVEANYPSGIYNYKFASADLRNTFFAAAEKYLLNNMYAGVPIMADSGFVLYSERLQLPVENAVPLMNYGPEFGTMTEDDSTVIMADGELGNAGEYTYRARLGENPTTFQQWIYDDETSADVMGWMLDAPYITVFNSAKDGFEVVPSMASDYPQPIDGRELVTGVEVSKIWQIPLRDDLVWTYHEDTDTSGFPVGHEIINATDFIDTYKLALDNDWFRATSGGGAFLTSSTEIKNAQAYIDDECAWGDIGIKKVDDNTIQFEFVNDMSEWNVRYFLASFVMGPINTDLYASLQDGEVNTYGTSAETTAYNGAYVMDYYEADVLVHYTKNPNFHNQDLYFYTNRSYRIILDDSVAFQEFIAGKLEQAGLQAANYDQYKTDPRLKRIPGETTYRLMINGLGTVENQQAQFEGSDYEPEPLLANQNFKRAMYFAINRKELAEVVLKTNQAQMYLYTDAYLIDPQFSTTAFRNTDFNDIVADGLSASTNGYNSDLSASYWTAAIDALVADGSYEEGTEANPTIINIDLNIYAGSDNQVLFGNFIKDAFETIFVSDTHHIKVEVTPAPKEFPSIYYDYMMIGNFDLSIGGIGGGVLDAANFLDTYCSDNRSGFTLNWGIDTSIPEIEVEYTDPVTGETITEMWSFDSIVSVLNGEATIIEGYEQDTFFENN